MKEQELTPVEEQQIKELIENDGIEIHERLVTAKEDIDILAKSTQETFGLKAGDFKKLVKLFYERSLEVEEEKANKVFELYKEIFGLWKGGKREQQ